jgi:serine/threonine protein kinase
MAADLAYRSYVSSTLLDTFLEDIPHVTQEFIHDLHEKDEWKNFIAKCTGGEKSGLLAHKSSDSNEEEFRELVQCIIRLVDLEERFGGQEEPEFDNLRWGRVRISHQGSHPMRTWNTKAKWLKGNYGSTARQKELKPDLMSIVVEDVEEPRPRKVRPRYVQLAKPQTILPPPKDWQPAQMDDKSFPIVEYKEPVWECLDLFWECKRNSQALKNAEVYIDCALKAAEALRYQWSRRYIHCFLHCGTIMQLLHFDRSGLMASELLDITTDTMTFVRCLLAVFLHKPARLGYPAGKYAPFHKHDPDDRLRQVVTVGNRQLYIDDQEAGPPRDHLVSRATVVFKAKLVNPKGREKTGWDWCYKSSWAQQLRIHEGAYLTRLQGLPNVVNLLVYDVVKVENDDDTTVFGRRCGSGQPMTLIETFYDRAKRQKTGFTQHSGTLASGQEGLETMLSDPRRPVAGSQLECDDREHRDIVTAWVNSSFNEAASLLDSLPTIFSIWQQAFSAIKSITEKGVIHRDISFRNIRIDDQHKIKVCDFDMAMFLNDASTGSKDRTGTLAFMATSILSSEPLIHRPVHDCESIFWLCVLDLLCRIGIGDTMRDVANIGNPCQGIDLVRSTKSSVLSSLSRVRGKTQRLKSSFSLDDSKDSSLFLCLTALAREFFENDFAMDFESATEGFESVCFDRCIEIIKEHIQSFSKP